MRETRRRTIVLGTVLAGSALLLATLLSLTARAAPLAPAPQAGNPLLLGHLGGAAEDVATDGTYVYAAVGPELVVVDPATAARVGYALVGELLHAVALSGTDVVAVGSRLRRFDVTDPQQPLATGSAGAFGDYRDVAAAGGYAFATRNDDDYPYGRLEVFQIGGAQPALIGGADLLATAYGVAVSGTLAGVAASTAGLLLLDVANPAAPAIIAARRPPMGSPLTSLSPAVTPTWLWPPVPSAAAAGCRSLTSPIRRCRRRWAMCRCRRSPCAWP